MNRPRNRQPKNPREDNNARRSNNHRGGSSHRGGRHNANAPRPAYYPVPTTSQVVVGATVSIVLKQDQGTGREVQGQVQELLTRGEHPRGIKVRLVDGRVGRVQGVVVDGRSFDSVGGGTGGTRGGEQDGFARSELRAGGDDGLPPPRSLADYLPSPPAQDTSNEGNGITFATATAKCPICDLFEGDEVAVSHHIETVHLT